MFIFLVPIQCCRRTFFCLSIASITCLIASLEEPFLHAMLVPLVLAVLPCFVLWTCLFWLCLVAVFILHVHILHIWHSYRPFRVLKFMFRDYSVHRVYFGHDSGLFRPSFSYWNSISMFAYHLPCHFMPLCHCLGLRARVHAFRGTSFSSHGRWFWHACESPVLV